MLSRRHALAAAAAALLAAGPVAAADQVKLAITQIVEHPALDACRKGVIDALAEAGWTEGQNLVVSYQSA